MDNDALTITKTLQQVKLIYEQVSLLLRSADNLLNEESWISHGNTAIYAGSAVIYNPRLWAPSIIQRSYTNAAHPDLRKFIAVALDDEIHPLDDGPIIIGTTLFGHESGSSASWFEWDAYWWHRNFFPASIDGKSNELDPRQQYAKDTRQLTKVAVFALPLTMMKNAEMLSTQVINPLLADTR